MERWVKVRDGVVGVGPVEVQSEGWAVRGVAQLALQAGVRLHVGVACPELVGKPLEASEMRMRREQRLLPLPSRGNSRKLIFSGGVNEVFTICELSVLALFLFM